VAPRSDPHVRSSANAEPKSIPQVATELWELTTSYAKQETIDPLKGLTRFLGYGVPGAISWGIGMGLLVLAALRALQTETGSAFTGNLSWVPYLIMAVLGTVIIVLSLYRVTKRKGPGA
jgi:hypothetical protein